MELNQIVGQATPVSNATSGNTSSVLSSDFEVFLKMLTAQAEYQDPLEPIDSSEYAAQLAQFSMVEQQVATNTLLEQVLTSLGASDMQGAANWIGLDALVAGPANFQGAPITIAPNPPVAADAVDMVVYTPGGAEVRRVSLPVSAENYTWDGRDNSGGVVPYGVYDIKIESRAGGTLLAEDSALTYGRVNEARIDSGTTLLVLQNGSVVDAQSVVGLRAPDAA